MKLRTVHPERGRERNLSANPCLLLVKGSPHGVSDTPALSGQKFGGSGGAIGLCWSETSGKTWKTGVAERILGGH